MKTKNLSIDYLEIVYVIKYISYDATGKHFLCDMNQY